MATGIKDRVAILGMGCSKFGERWDMDAPSLMVEAFEEAIADAGIDPSQLEAGWFGHAGNAVGPGAIPLAIALRLHNVPVTRVENACATGTEALRGAAYAVASGACDIAFALGVEKLKDAGYGGLAGGSRGPYYDAVNANVTAPGGFAQLASGYAARHGVDMPDLKRAMAHISVKSHANGVINEKAHLRRRITEAQAIDAPMIAYPLGLFDCCGVSDGAACAIVTTPEIARALGKKDIVTIKALQLAATGGWEAQGEGWDYSYVPTTRAAAARAYKEAGISDPRTELSLTEVHDCFSITELVTMEDLGLSMEGEAVRDVLDGKFDADGQIPCQIDGGLKCFGHPIGATGIRMVYENYLQLLGRAGDRQRQTPVVNALSHNLGGAPFHTICSIAIVGLQT
ncbi:acetyl-CoA acetyltransferase [Brevundimonas sp.]|uniref:acetyl-CoA acetyltransferase n=1 Tax=Brevundimonas sp. TaxID=1871086 RepID=UPI00356377B9